MNRIVFIVSLLIVGLTDLSAQSQKLSGTVLDSISERPIKSALIILNNQLSTETDNRGEFSFDSIPINTFTLTVFKDELQSRTLILDPKNLEPSLTILMKVLSIELQDVEVIAESSSEAMEPLPAVVGTSIYKGMKSESIKLENVTANFSNNNSRQIYNSIAGLNIWESDGAGIQLGIGARGLSPNRTSHFNVRQDLHDISADALGYPESYYTPSIQAVKEIQLVRGAAGLQYGTQFGGLLNFKMKDPPREDTLYFELNQAVTGFGLDDSLTSPIANTTTYLSSTFRKNRTGLYAYYQYKQGDGWRERSAFDVHSGYLSFSQDWNSKLSTTLNLTHMNYLAKQPGGLTDDQFNENPRLTERYRNWFKVNWNLGSLVIDWNPNSLFSLQSNTVALMASREALGFLGETQRPDPQGPRDLISSDFKNIGHETRVLRRWATKDSYIIASAGVRFYRGFSNTQQGNGNDGAGADFEFDEEVIGERTDFDFPNYNAAVFAQTIIPLSKKLSITPGMRYEYIDTRSDGTFRSLVRDDVGNVLEDTLLSDSQTRVRDFVLLGIGLSYKTEAAESYFNAVQNYRAINFTDIQVRNRSLVIDPEIMDERGYNIDLGVRGKLRNLLSYDVSVFYLDYSDRIGGYFKADELNRAIRFRTNVSDARTIGIELFTRVSLDQLLFKENENQKLSLFLNGSVIDSKYVDSDITAFEGNEVELVPDFTIRTGVNWQTGNLSLSVQYGYVAEQFSDATNVGQNPRFPATRNAVDGIIPAYQVIDLSSRYTLGSLQFSFSLNNLSDEFYFTRRASGYPGPGIIPSDGRNYTLGVTWKLGV